ncbi:MAG: ribosomal RNA small subunit methyltransferase A [Bacilli bacterium]|nr:ribosomal RNA small subunit methyltransferase A [Bacilli bacterium]
MEKYNVKFKKKYGQNFLKDVGVVKRIVAISDIDKESLVIEVGPGGAIMTKELAVKAGRVLAYEIDTDLVEELNNKLQEFDNVDVLFQDFLISDLKNDVKSYDYKKLFFTSNVPYYITTPIIMKLIKSNLNFEKIVMMVQKEVGDRFTSLPGNREYGSITVLLNYFFEVKKEFFVSKKQFVPEPKVDSVIISFSNREERLYLKSFDFFEKILHDSFQYKRKNLKNNLNNYDLEIVGAVLKKYGYDLTVRAEMLKYEIFVELANSLYENR